MTITFSICIPNYNYAKYIGETVRSVLEQDYPHFEVIVADNASTDASVEVVRAFGDPRVRVVENRRNVGFAPNLDKATEHAKNDFMILLSSDDVMRPGALRRYAEVLAGLGPDAARAVLTSAVDVIDGEGRITDVAYRKAGELFYSKVAPDAFPSGEDARVVERWSGLRALRESLRAKNTPAYFMATCYSRALYDAVEGYRSMQRIWPDSDFLNKLLGEDPVFVYVPERLFGYRVHNANQLAQEAAQGALKYHVDAYMHTVEFPEPLLKKLGMTRDELVEVFIEKAVMERGLQSVAAGSVEKGLRLLAFALATYPRQTLREPKALALAGLVALGPLGPRVAERLYRWRKELRR